MYEKYARAREGGGSTGADLTSSITTETSLEEPEGGAALDVMGLGSSTGSDNTSPIATEAPVGETGGRLHVLGKDSTAANGTLFITEEAGAGDR